MRMKAVRSHLLCCDGDRGISSLGDTQKYWHNSQALRFTVATCRSKQNLGYLITSSAKYKDQSKYVIQKNTKKSRNK